MRLWKVETEVIPIVVEALGTVAKSLEKNLKKAGSSDVNKELRLKARPGPRTRSRTCYMYKHKSKNLRKILLLFTCVIKLLFI